MIVPGLFGETIEENVVMEVIDQDGLPASESGIVLEEDVPHLFGRFHRGRNTANLPGNGLGLAIVLAIVLGMNGRITLQPLSPGTQVVIHLPGVPGTG